MIILESTTRISNGSSFNGDLSTAGKLIISGDFNGNANVEGILQLTSSGTCAGDIKAQVAIINGTIKGDIYTEHRLELRSDAKVLGNISTPALIIREGARITGNVNVGTRPKLTLIENNKTQKLSVVNIQKNSRVANHG